MSVKVENVAFSVGLFYVSPRRAVTVFVAFRLTSFLFFRSLLSDAWTRNYPKPCRRIDKLQLMARSCHIHLPSPLPLYVPPTAQKNENTQRLFPTHQRSSLMNGGLSTVIRVSLPKLFMMPTSTMTPQAGIDSSTNPNTSNNGGRGFVDLLTTGDRVGVVCRDLVGRPFLRQ